jgi:transposase
VTARPLDPARDALIALQGQVIVVLAERNSVLEARVGELEDRLARLERAMSRNSGNSSMPPSADDLPGKTAPAPKPERGDGKKRQGKQYDGHAVACACGRVHVAPPPDGAGEAGTVTYGLNLQAWAVFLLVMHHVPVERCADVIGALTGTRPSDGFVHGMLARAARAVRGACMLIRALVITAAVLCADETPLRVGPGPKARKKYLLVALHEPADLLLSRRPVDEGLRRVRVPGPVRVRARARPVPELRRGPRRAAPAVHPAHPARPGGRRPVLPGRDLAWPGSGRAARLIHAANTARDKGLAAAPDDATAAGLMLFRNAVRVGLSEVRRVPGAKTKQEPGCMLLECLKERENDVLRFLGDLRIPPTSNQAERDLRPSKTQQKISGRLRPETATRNRYAIRGYIDTARKHGEPVTAIRDALAGNPWMPAIPA